MKHTLAVLGLPLIWLAYASAEEPVYFADANLKAAVEEQLWVTNPTPTDMLALTELTSIQPWDEQDKGIASITGLEYAKNLQTLNLRLNQISDISALSGLTNLSSLDLSQNFISDISPLSELNNISYLNIHENCISDLSPLSGLTNVWTLVLRVNAISDLSPLSSMVSLRNVELSYNQISDVSPLSALPHLSSINLDTNFVTDLSPLCSMRSLTELSIYNNPLTEKAYAVDIPCIVANNPNVCIESEGHAGRYLTISSTVGGEVTTPGEGLFAYENNQSVRLTAKADPGFVFAHWTGKRETTDNPVSIVMNGDCSMRACFFSLRDTLHVDDDAAGAPGADGSPEHPMGAIQDAIDAAGPGVTIIVRPGTYRENINLSGKKIHLLGVDPADPHGGPCAIIEGTGGGPVVSIPSGAGSGCSLSGFVITRGRGDMVGGVYCGGSHPALSHCLIVGNRCSDPNGAVMYFDGSKAVLVNCTIADNYGGPDGSALMLVDSDITMVDSIVWGNRPDQIRRRGTSTPSIRYCCVEGWWPDIGNIHADPLFVHPGCWTNPDDASVRLAPNDPHAVWVDGDYHLRSRFGRWDLATQSWRCDETTSPCIDTGDPESEIEYESAPNGGIINMGAYGGTTEAGKGPARAVSP